MKITKDENEFEIDTLGYYIDRALNVMVKQLNKLFVEKGIDLQHAQYTVLKVLWCGDGISQSQLSKYLGKNPAAVSRSLNYLESKGYISRVDTNGKTNKVYLTDYANTRRNDIEAVANMVTDKVTRGMTQHQSRTLKDLLTKIYKNSK